MSDSVQPQASASASASAPAQASGSAPGVLKPTKKWYVAAAVIPILTGLSCSIAAFALKTTLVGLAVASPVGVAVGGGVLLVLTCVCLYKARPIKYDIQKAKGDLESLPKNITCVDNLRLERPGEKKLVCITFTKSEAKTSKEILERMIKDVFHENKEVTYFDPTSAKLYSLNEEKREPTEIMANREEIQTSLENGQNYKGIVVRYARILIDKLDEMPINNKVQGEAQIIPIQKKEAAAIQSEGSRLMLRSEAQVFFKVNTVRGAEKADQEGAAIIDAYEYSTALEQINCALQELEYVTSQKN